MGRHALFFASAASLGLIAATQVPPTQVPSTLVERYDLETPSARVSLRHRLDEVSGLAVTDDGRVFAHDDERAVIYQVDPSDGTLLKRFSISVPVLPGDFEGMAVAGDRFFLMSSQGLLLEFREGDPEQSVAFRGIDTRLLSRCEAEGLAFEPATEALVVACKTVPRGDAGYIVLYRIQLSDLTVQAARIRIPVAALEAVGLSDGFAPSGVAVDPETGRLILISARTESLAEITPAGEVVAGLRFGSRRHPQAEGIGFLPDGTLLLADEAQSNRAHITTYSPRPAPPGNAP